MGIFILLYIIVVCSMGFGALAKKEIVISKNRKFTGKGTKPLGTVFLVSGALAAVTLLLPSEICIIVAGILVAVTALASIVLALSKGTPTVFATLADGETAPTQCPKCKGPIDVIKKQIGTRILCPKCNRRVFIGPF